MVTQQDIQPLLDMGFQPVDLKQAAAAPLKGWHGTMPAEPVNTRPHHFTPKFRIVSVMPARQHGGFVYTTSDVVGTFRGYRCRRVEEHTRKANVSAHGRTAAEAVLKWTKVFRAYMKGVRSRA